MKSVILIFVSLPLSFTAFAEEAFNKEKVIALADELAKCAGFHDATGKHSKELGLDQSVIETLEGSARGSRLVATHLLSAALSEGKKPPAEYNNYVDSIAYTIETRTSMLWSFPDSDTEAMDELNAMGQKCGELSKFQGAYIDQLRKNTFLPK